MLNRSASLAMSTCVLKALPGKIDIKRHSPSILYIQGRVQEFWKGGLLVYLCGGIYFFFLNIQWKWNNLVSQRPNYFSFKRIFKNWDGEGIRAKSLTHIWRHLYLIKLFNYNILQVITYCHDNYLTFVAISNGDCCCHKLSNNYLRRNSPPIWQFFASIINGQCNHQFIWASERDSSTYCNGKLRRCRRGRLASAFAFQNLKTKYVKICR